MAEELPDEVKAELHAAFEAVAGMGKEELIAFAAERGQEYKDADVNEGFLKRKCKKLAQTQILDAAGIKQSDAAPDVAEGDADKPKKKPGRKKMVTKGDFKIVLKEGQGAGREGSTKFKVVTALKDKEKFNFEDFQAAVVEAMQYNAEKEEFGINTKFPSIGAATGAWFSELKNKQEIIHPIVTEGEKTTVTEEAAASA